LDREPLDGDPVVAEPDRAVDCVSRDACVPPLRDFAATPVGGLEGDSVVRLALEALDEEPALAPMEPARTFDSMPRIIGTLPPVRCGGVKISGLEVEPAADRPVALLRRRNTSCTLGFALCESLDASERGDDVAGRTGDEGIAERRAVELVPGVGEGLGEAAEDPDCDFRKDSNSRFTELDRPADVGGLTRRVGAAEVRPGVAVDDLKDDAFGREVLDGCVADERVEECSRLRSAVDEPTACEADGVGVGLLGILMLAEERELEPEEWLTMGGRLVRAAEGAREGVCVERLGIRKPADEREDAPDDRAAECGLPARAVFE
jgi:hypothetical protein